MKKILIIFILFFLLIPKIKAEETNLVNIYFFHSNSCPHCQAEEELLEELEIDYDNIKIYRYEINTDNNSNIFKEVVNRLDINVTGVPFTIIGSKTFSGYSIEYSKEKFKGAIEYYSNYGYKDIIGEYLNLELPTYPVLKDQITVDKYINEYGNYTFNLPLFGKIETKNLTLPVISIVIGLIDGFNPCAMWVLLFLISMLIGMKDKKRMWTLGTTFLVTSALIYLLFMIAWLNVANLLVAIKPVRITISLIALAGGIINLRSYLKHRKDNGCDIVNDNKRKKIFTKIKALTNEKSFILAILGIITLAISVNIIELACSAGLPIIFAEILSLNNLTIFEQSIYIFLYILFFLIDDLIVFFIAMTTLHIKGFSTKYGKISKLIGGIILVLMGILLLIKPEWLMLNFK